MNVLQLKNALQLLMERFPESSAFEVVFGEYNEGYHEKTGQLYETYSPLYFIPGTIGLTLGEIVNRGGENEYLDDESEKPNAVCLTI